MKKTKRFKAYYRSPLGWLRIEGEGPSLHALEFAAKKGIGAASALPAKVNRELAEYFKGKRKRFSLRLDPKGTPFQQKVWKALQKVSHGKKVSYSALAERIGRRKSVRAVANAVGRNKLAILIPCHRVVGKDGSLTGYAYGLKKKAWLLRREKSL